MRTLNNYVLLKELQNNGDVTPEGVILPETIKLQYEIGLVITTHENNSSVETGNLIAYNANSGVRIMMEGQSCRFILEGNIIAILQENALEEAVEKH